MEQISQKSLNKMFEEYFDEDEDEDYRRIAKEDAKYRIERRLRTRESILDSIGINHKRIIIIDVLSHDVGGSYEETFYFYDGNILRVVQSREFETEFKPLILKIEELKPIQHGDITAFYNHFNKQTHKEINTYVDFNPEILRFGAFYITVVLNKKVRFYYTNNVDLMNNKKIEVFE